MTSNEFEKAFSDFLDSKTCDQAQDKLFSALRTAFLAGWQAAEQQAREKEEK